MKAAIVAAITVAVACAGCASHKERIREKVAVVAVGGRLAPSWAGQDLGFEVNAQLRGRERPASRNAELVAHGIVDGLERDGFEADVCDDRPEGVSAVVIVGPCRVNTNIDGCLFAGMASTEMVVQVCVVRGDETVHDRMYGGRGSIIVLQPFAMLYVLVGGRPGAVPELRARGEIVRASTRDVLRALRPREEAGSP